MRVTVLGCGTSTGVPVVGCPCNVCASGKAKNVRTRSSLLVEWRGKNLLVDTAPDLHQQALQAKLRRVDAVFYTHGHADHILGLDDIRPFNLKQRAEVPLYGSRETLAIIARTFAYIFDDSPTQSTIPGVRLCPIDGPFDLFGLHIIPVPAMHGSMPVLGFRFGRAAYLTDFSSVPESSRKLLLDLDDFILDALRFDPHPMHSSVDESLALIAELQPKRAYFTHIAHDLAHEEVNAKLPAHVRLSYDGLTFEVAC